MAKTIKNARPLARLPKGLRDSEAAELLGRDALIATIRRVYETYGFEPLETPAFEYTEALGKFLPDQDRPNEGVFSFQDDDEQWLSLRYDLTAPLARYVAENYARLPKPFRRYAYGPVFRNEKPGPGRFREFIQFDADTVGTESLAADAEMCMLAADTLEALGIERGQYVIKVSSRNVLDGLRQSLGLAGAEFDARWLTAMRALDKYDRLGEGGVAALLGKGRKDESGDFTKGAQLDQEQIDKALSFFLSIAKFGMLVPEGEATDVEKAAGGVKVGLKTLYDSNRETLAAWEESFAQDGVDLTGVAELQRLIDICESSDFRPDRIRVDGSVVRGLEYYTGPVFEAELMLDINGEGGQTVRFGSVGGGGRYDDLVARFTGEKIPATGFSIGVSRLQAALAALGRAKTTEGSGPVVVLVMDRAELPRYQKMTSELRAAGVRAEMYLGSAGMKAQMKYADKRNAPCVVIQGSRERDAGEVQIKDLVEGAKAAAAIEDNKAWKEQRPAQVSVPEDRMVETVREVLARHS